MKDKKIVPQTPEQSEKLADASKADARRKRELNRSHRLFLNHAISGLAELDPADCSEARRKETLSALFDVIAEARKAVLRLTGARGIITQEELGRFDRLCTFRLLMDNPGKEAIIQQIRDTFWKDLRTRFEAGWKVEPGPLFMCANRVGLNVGYREAGASYAPRIEQSDTPASRQADTPTRQADPQTPSVETLQAWFDLPSEPPHAEDTQGES